jgi:hypothetical protein
LNKVAQTESARARVRTQLWILGNRYRKLAA